MSNKVCQIYAMRNKVNVTIDLSLLNKIKEIIYEDNFIK